MLSDTIKVEAAPSAVDRTGGSGGGGGGGGGDGPTKAKGANETGTTKGKGANETAPAPSESVTEGPAANGCKPFPPPKNDKPRPHICGTCNRSFARLEHLKRHERSHTKEKPFECPECTRCFARRDLLLRHQQKLHLTTTPSSRPRSGRRESTSSNTHGVGKARKSSMGNQNGSGSMRPRANTISHVDGATLGMIAAANSSARRHPVNLGHSTHPSLNGFAPNGGPHRTHGLAKLDTNGLNIDLGGGLRTAPAFGQFPQELDMNAVLFGGGNTVNPAQLHFADSPQSMVFDNTPVSPFPQGFGLGQVPSLDDDTGFEWINGFDNQLSFGYGNENAIAGSSPSAISTGSPGVSEIMPDGFTQTHQSPDQWQNSIQAQGPLMSDYSMDLSGSGFPDHLQDALSEKVISLTEQNIHFVSPAPFSMHAEPSINISNPMFLSQPEEENHMPPHSSNSSHRAINAVDTITDATRKALIGILSQPAGGAKQRTYSQPAVSSPLSPNFGATPRNGNHVILPSTTDLKRYISAYINYFHPRLPLLHVPTLSFDSPSYEHHLRTTSSQGGHCSPGGGGDGGCLILSMAAIGALFEYDYAASRELFEAAKKLISNFIEERRRADLSAAVNAASGTGVNAQSNTPLWLVQSMLLNVVYGHNCGDRTSADIASTHCAALVSLARAAGLANAPEFPQNGTADIHMTGDGWNAQQSTTDDSAWYTWKTDEERKRTLYSIFVLSSMLVSTYNFSPCLTNSEIQLDLPCDEDIWEAETPSAWYGRGGSIGAAQKAVSFAAALSSLLTASSRYPFQPHQILAENRPTDSRLSSPNLPPAEFHASSFGCLVLIDALHNYIWETRQRHLGRQWTTQETEAMQAHIGPALLAYQAVWRSSPQHSIQRPNPYGTSDLSADCVPWLDLAYVRLFVALGRSKENFWLRDWDAMAHEIARGCEIVQHADDFSAAEASPSDHHPLKQQQSPDSIHPGDLALGGGRSSKRERHLRKAASHATHALVVADKFGVSLADFPAREMSIGSAMCAMDCAQVVSEWVATLQERVGPYVGVLGRDGIDYEGVPAIMLLEQEDISLLGRIERLVGTTEAKLAARTQQSESGVAGLEGPGGGLVELKGVGLSSKVLLVTASMCDNAAAWSVMHLMARSLESQAEFMRQRAEKSLVKQDGET